MEMKKIILALTTCLMLTGCVSIQSSNSSQSNDNSQTETESSQSDTGEVNTEEHGSGSEDVTPESYKINIKNNIAEVSLVSDKTKATEGEKVTITATVNSESYILSNVFFDGEPCKKENATTYSFIMPNHAVFITCSVAVVSGDVRLQGEITAVFAKENSLYVARDVKVSKDSQFDMVVSHNGQETKMRITDFDRTKTFANIGFTSGSDNAYDLKIDGGATYDFYYDPSNGDRPCYVMRSKVDVLPTSPDGLYKMFNGTIGTETSVLPQNLVKTVFKNSLTNETLTWNLGQDNASLAQISKVNMSNEEVVKAVVFSQIKDDKLTVVDTFVPGVSDAYQQNNIFSRDKKVYSGEYKISTTNPDKSEPTDKTEFKEYQNYVDPNIAQMMVNHSPVTMEAYESEIMDAYRVGYLIEGEVTQANSNVKSSQNEDGSFTVKVVSSRTVDSTSDRGSGAKFQRHYEYRVDLTFDKAGALLSSTYASKSFAEGEYDFKALKFVNGTVEENWENNGNVEKQLSLVNTYGKPSVVTTSFDPSPYIVSEIKNVSIINKDIKDKQGNRLNLGDRLEVTGDEKTSTVVFDVLPVTALNKGQYKVIASSNKESIDKINGFWTAKGVGESNVTIGISNGFGVKSVNKVNVYCTYMLRSVYLYDERGQYPNIINTISGIVYTGKVNPFRIQVQESGHNKVVPMPMDMNATFVKGGDLGFEISFDYAAQVMNIDASHSTAKGGETIEVEIKSSIYDPGWITKPIIFTFEVKKSINEDALLGEWIITGGGVDKITFTKESGSNKNAKRPYKGVLVVDGQEYVFDYGYDAFKNEINVELVGEKYSFSTFKMIYNDDSNTLSVIFVYKQWTNPPTPDEEILGYEDGGDGDHYVDFIRAGEENA